MLAAYGLLDGKVATTHHLYERELQQRYPAVHFINGMRFVENDKISTAAGPTSGINLALHLGWSDIRTRRPPGYCRLHGVSRRIGKNPELATLGTEAAGK